MSLAEKPGKNPLATKRPDQADAIVQQVDRILDADLIKGSRSLHALLRFIVEAKLDGRDDEIKETILATEVFGRRADFDSRADPVARVHAHRLRKKLKEYYEGPGADDPWRIDIPVGSYVPEITPSALDQSVSLELEPAPPTTEEKQAVPAPAAEKTRQSARPARALVWALAAVAAASMAVAAVTVIQARHPTSGPLSATDRLWEPFLSVNAAPTSVVFNELVFLSNDKILLRYNGPYSGPTGAGFPSLDEVRPYVDSDLLDRAGPLLFNRTYASLGQVYSVRSLSLLFARSGKEPALRPFRLLRPDEAASENLILSDTSNLAAVGLSLEHFRRVDGSYGYKSANPPAIESISSGQEPVARFELESDVRTQERKVDYAVVAWLPGRKPHLRVVLIDGLTSAASWAATKALTTDDGVEELERALGTPRPDFFEAVVRAEIKHDQVMSFSFVKAKARRFNPSGAAESPQTAENKTK